MAETKQILVLANSAWSGKHCVAGKIVTPAGDGKYDVAKQWTRLIDPREPAQGAVPWGDTRCRPGPNGLETVRPLDVITVTLQSHCNNRDHPEDWYYDPNQRWQYTTTLDAGCLPAIADTPQKLWHTGHDSKSVPAGYVAAMAADAATLYLIKAPAGWSFTHWKEDNRFGPMPKTYRRLQFQYAGTHHDFSVTDRAFTDRYKVFDQMQMYRHQTLQVPNPAGVFFCLSLTKPDPKYGGTHNKICATIFET